VVTPEQVMAPGVCDAGSVAALVLLAAATSLRWGELMALTRADLDLARICHAVARLLWCGSSPERQKRL
jgi:integrase